MIMPNLEKVEVTPTCISDQNLDFSYFELHIPCNEDKNTSRR